MTQRTNRALSLQARGLLHTIQTTTDHTAKALAQAARISLRSVQRHLAELRKAGAITPNLTITQTQDDATGGGNTPPVASTRHIGICQSGTETPPVAQKRHPWRKNDNAAAAALRSLDIAAAAAHLTALGVPQKVAEGLLTTEDAIDLAPVVARETRRAKRHNPPGFAITLMRHPEANGIEKRNGHWTASPPRTRPPQAPARDTQELARKSLEWDRLYRAWNALPDHERAQIEAKVREATPALVTTPAGLRGMCLREMEARGL